MAGLTNSPVKALNEKSVKCMFCDTIDTQWIRKSLRHLVITLDDTNHMHVHGDLKDSYFIDNALKVVKREVFKYQDIEEGKQYGMRSKEKQKETETKIS